MPRPAVEETPNGDGIASARTIARELEELGARLVELSRRVEELSAKADRDPSNGALLSAREVVERTGLSRGQVYALGRRGEAGAVRIGERGVRFSESGLTEWMECGGSS